MPRFLFSLITAVFLAHMAQAADFADPQPTMDSPRQIIVQVETGDEGKLNSILYNVMNIQKHYGVDNVELRVVAYGAAVRALMLDTSKLKDRVTSMQMYDIQFVSCGNTMETIKKTPADLIEGVETITSGLPYIIEHSLMGWQVIRP